jgi:hypothetical protein
MLPTCNNIIYIQGGAVNCGLKGFFLQCIGLLVLLKHMLGLMAGPLANHLNNFYFIFLSNALTAAGKSGMFCGSGLPLAGPIPQKRTDIEPKN